MTLPRIGRCRLSELLLKAGTSQSELARRLSVTEPTVSNWCYGKKRISLERAIQISYILNCNIEDLYSVDFD